MKKVILDNDYRTAKYRLKHCDPETENFYYSYNGMIFDMENPESIQKAQKLMVSARDYEIAKNFNSYLIEVTRLKKLDEWLYYPSELQIEHTNRCNARCIMCGHYNVDKSKCHDIDEGLIRKLEYMFPFVRYIGIHGYGEPFLTTRLLDYFELYKKYKIRLYANTNMSFMPKTYYPYIREMFDEINISCESVHKETYEKIRQGLHFERFVRNIDSLHHNCPQVSLNLFVVVMRQNLLELSEIVDFAADHGFVSVQFTEMIAMDANDNFGDAPSVFPTILSAEMKKASQQAKKRNIQIRFPLEYIIEGDDEEELKKELVEWKRAEAKERPTAVTGGQNLLFDRKQISCRECSGKLHSSKGICDIFAGQLYCSLDGKLAACCVDGYHFTEYIDDIHTIREYWRADHVKMIRDCFEGGKIPSICNNCNYILLDCLKHLKVTDREKYQNGINTKD